MKKSTIYFSLGTNVGNRKFNLINCISRINKNIGNVERISSIYKNPAIGFDGDFFFNCCIEVSSSLAVKDVLSVVLNIEKEMGRTKRLTNKYESRIIDIDIILFGNTIVNNTKLVIPHPRYSLRDFVIIPLLEINNKLKDPQSGQLISVFLEKFKKNKLTERLDF